MLPAVTESNPVKCFGHLVTERPERSPQSPPKTSTDQRLGDSKTEVLSAEYDNKRGTTTDSLIRTTVKGALHFKKYI